MGIDIITSRQLRADGGSSRHLEHGVRTGRFVRVRPGVYAVANEWNAADAAERHRAAMDALIRTAVRTPVFSHESAALLHGIPVVGGWSEVPHLVESELDPASRRSPRAAIVHRPRFRPELCAVAGMLATAPLATAISLAASRPLAAGVAAIDHVLAGEAARADFERTIAEWRPFHGSRRVRLALDHATGLAETPLESISFVGMLRSGIAEPLQQVEIPARGRRYRVDFLWPELGVVGEADGRLKYRTGADLLAEKRREDDIRSLGFGFARWEWEDAWNVAPMIAKLAEAGIHPAPRSARYSAG
jgi:hypothetical protein